MLGLAQSTDAAMIFCKKCWMNSVYVSISARVWGTAKVGAWHSASLNFSRFNSFQAQRLVALCGLLLRDMQVEIGIWSDNWFNSGRDLQCSSLSTRNSNINTRSIVLKEFLASHVIVPLGSVNDKLASSTIFSNWLAAACWVGLEGPFQNGWCRLKSPSKAWYGFAISWRLTKGSVDGLSVEE